MRKSFGPIAKPLVSVLGVPLIERNLMALLRAGQREIVVAMPDRGDDDIDAWVKGRGAALARAAHASIEAVREGQARGNIGYAGEFHGIVQDLLVVFADNLTTLDLSEILVRHKASGADLTLATHDEPFAMPYGEVELIGERIAAYREKPIKRYRICSAVSVLGRRALEILHKQGQRPVGLSDLFRMAADEGQFIRAHQHAADWIDVNDANAIARAETMLLANREAFDCWLPEPSSETTLVAAQTINGLEIWQYRSTSGTSGAPDEPGWRNLGVFDDLDCDDGATRYRLFASPHGRPEDENSRGKLTHNAQADGHIRRALAIAMAAT